MSKAQISMTISLLGSIAIQACGASGPRQPALAEDPTASASVRRIEIGTCRWAPALPADREDPCDQTNEGTTLEVTAREDMRPESATTGTHTCGCE
ncbi:MAG: hypothetical protein MUF54_05285 [Polyangiaceae bacterium]|jgi:hypothetical protein|nr:hypothetical protein [Polyangiaceae bacterium]